MREISWVVDEYTEGVKRVDTLEYKNCAQK